MSLRRTRVARTSRSRPARRARLLTRRAKLNAARRPRRGVLLLVVLSLLVLFLMVGTAFVITAKQSEKAAKTAMKGTVRLAGEAAQADLLDEVLHQIIRDTNNPNSSLRFHSLLGDMYGNDGLKGVIDSTTPPTWAGGGANGGVTGGQMLEFRISTAANMLRDLYGNTVDAVGNPLAFSNLDNAYNGQVLTFLSGVAKGRSTRIVGFIPPNTFRVMNVQLADGSLITDPTLLANGTNNSRVLINGRPFSGTGVGFNPWAADDGPKLNAEEGLVIGGSPQFFPLALMPNAAFQMTSASTGSTLVNINLPGTPPPGFTDPHRNYYFPRTTTGLYDYSGRGGANEGYDAPDFQNMALAYLPATRLVETALPDVTGALPPALAITGATGNGTMVIPSWHRPDLINYWANGAFANGSDGVRSSRLAEMQSVMMLRRIMLRPNWIDHPNFTGSNPELAAIPAAQLGQKLARMVYGPWDVDNDNDGVRDSVWIDVGLPVMAGPNGKLVKPLVAMLIADMDGRASVNAAGSCDLAGAWDDANTPTGLNAVAGTGTMLASGVTSKTTPRGVGHGPADVSLEQVTGPGDFKRILIGDTINGQFVPGRYGHVDASNFIRPGAGRTVDLLSQVQFFGWPESAGVRSNFGSPSDLRARYGNGVNYHGQPAFDATINAEMTDPNASLLIDSPYEINLSQKVAAGMQGYGGSNPRPSDAVFSEAELERVLRIYDADAGSLPGRLAVLSGLAGDLAVRNKITTTSYDLPVPGISLPHELANDPQMWSPNPQYRRLPKSAAEVIEMRVRKGLGLAPFPVPVAGADALKLREALRQVVAPELASGGRLNINRPLGNGRDDNNNGVVDEPGEDVAGTRSIWSSAQSAMATSAGFDAMFPGLVPQFRVTDNTDPLNPVYGPDDAVDHRHLLARHLYVTALAMAAEEDYDGTQNGDEELARRTAQWAVNVVDFRDPDNIMTPFEYDLNPFDGWDVNGWVGDKLPGPDGIAGNADDVATRNTDDSGNANRRLVWGAERPELVMTETMAWHNRNTTDEADDDPNDGEQPGTTQDQPNADPDFDQLYRPHGAFFLELYNPWPATPTPSLDTHAANGNVDRGVDLAAVSAASGSKPASPVWRVIVTRDVDQKKDPDDPTPANRPTNVDRSIYFAKSDPGFADDGVAFYSSDNGAGEPLVRPVRPGRYLVVGSGKEYPERSGIFASFMGQRLDQAPNDATRKPMRRLELDTNDVEHTVRLYDAFDNADAVAKNDDAPKQTPPLMAFDMQAPSEQEARNAMPALTGNDRRSISDVAIINFPRPFTLSEPAGGYPTRVGNVEFVPTQPARGQTADPSEDGKYCWGGDAARPKAIDTPLDDGDQELEQLGTDFTRGRRLFLQRLANPLLPYDAETNPYLTIDDTQAYITVFNGRLSASQEEQGRKNSNARGGFSSAERGYGYRGQPTDFDFWKTRVPDVQATDRDTKRGGIRNDPKFSMRYLPQVTLGFLNKTFMDQNAVDAVALRAQPDQPFPWLTWNNRPYVSGNELMLVPRHRSSQLLKYFQSAENPPTAMQQYEPTDPDDPRQLADPNFQPKPFSHLENFFSTEALGTPQAGVPLHLYRLLDLIETPSLFVGTETWLNPTNFDAATASAQITSPTDPRAQLLAPFNRISEFRDPGLINLNTVSERDAQKQDRTVWDAMFHGRADRQASQGGRIHPGPSLEEWVKSRRGYGAAGAAATLLSDKFPTVFANPLRPADAGDWVPTKEMMRDGVDVTLLRSINGKSGADVTGADKPAPQGDPLFTTELLGANNDFRNSERNGFFRYQPMVRLDNLTTGRSNVYAVWVTIGFFEVEDAEEYRSNFNAAHAALTPTERDELFKKVYPDGYAFAREDGVDVGNTRRLRGFYIIDRTKMAGFEPGADHNVENVIRLRRRIE